MNQKIYSILLLILVVASYFHIQPVVLGISVLIIAMPLKKQSEAIKIGKTFAVLLLPIFTGLIAGYKNENYLIFKDAYYFLFPALFILSGIVLACRLQIEYFLKALVYAGVITSVMVTSVSLYYMGFGSLTDPYSAHYAIGIVGAPGPPIALACLLLSRKFNITLFSRMRYNMLLAINGLGLYMFSSRTYLIITLCFMLLLVADKVKTKWVMPVSFFAIMLIVLFPFNLFRANTSGTSFIDKILGSFNELSIGNYNTEEEINTKYRGYESFMALSQYAEGDTKDWIFGGLGKQVDLKTFMKLGEDTEFRYIPVLHNGWLYLLIKTGIFGVLIYIIVFLRLTIINWRRYASQKSSPAIKLFAALLVGCILSLFLTNYIVTALFNVEMGLLMIILGYSYLNLKYLLFLEKQQEEKSLIPVDLLAA